jgi:PAS domain S-box-containing protein
VENGGLDDLLHRSFVEATAAMTMVSPDGRFLRVNAAACDLLGRSEDELLSLRVSDVSHPDDTDAGTNAIRDALARGDAGFTIRRRFRRPSGDTVWTEQDSVLLKNADGTPWCITSRIVDISEVLAAEEAANRWKLVFDSTTRGMAIVDPTSGRIIAANAALAAMHGRPPGALDGTPLEDLFTADDATRLPERTRDAEHTGRLVYDSDHLRADGTVFPVRAEVMACFADDGPVLFRVAFFDDLTETRRLEVERADALASLRAANVELERSNADLAQFAVVASHDLRAPLATIASFADLVLDRFGADLPEEAGRWLQMVIDGVERMNAQVEGLLRYCNAGADSINLEEVDLQDVVDGALESLDSVLRARAAVVHVDPLPTVVADRQMLHQILLNVVANSVKFCPPTRAPAIDLAATVDDTHVTVHVDDNGIGIPSSQRERAVRMFERLHSEDVERGSGMGLAICDRLAQRLGGDLRIDDAPKGEGTRISVRLPRP